ncbi:helix-turn-helix domain-containing protein [soil metagenome]
MANAAPEAPADAIEPLMTIDALTRVLACDRRTIERMRSAGHLPRPDLMIGRRSPRWKPETIRAWVERGGRS